MLLRLKGEPHDEDVLAEDEGDLDVDDRADQSPSESVFAEDDEELAWPLRGLAIATATFVPTFVAIVFGLPYLFAPADAPRAAAVLKPPPMANRASEAPVAPPLTPSDSMKPPVAPAPTPSESMKVPVAPPQEEARAAVESTLPAPPPALPPIKEQRPQVAEPPRLPAPAPEPSLPSRPVPKPRITASEPPAPTTPPPASKESRAPVMKEPVVTKETPPVREAVAKDTTGWTPAAAFADRAAAQRLASGIEQQGYPVEIRQDGSSTRPWVVWIGAQPRSNGGGQRRH